jgi:hypothetical protein
MPNRRPLLVATAAVLAVTLLSGCGLLSSFTGGGAPPAVGPGAPIANPGTGAGGGGAVGGNPGTGIGLPAGPNGPVPNNPTIVVVHPGQVGLRQVSPFELLAVVDATHRVTVRVRWWGGIEPCEVLDSVLVARDGSTFTITARVGSAPGGQVACIEIARDTATMVDLGVLASGTYTVRASAGDAPPIAVTVP